MLFEFIRGVWLYVFAVDILVFKLLEVTLTVWRALELFYIYYVTAY